MQFVLRQQAGEHEVFSANAFDSLVGTLVPMNLKERDDGPALKALGKARLVSATITNGGKSAELTLEIPADGSFIGEVTADLLLKQMGDMSFRFK
jgi:hypothetical protein